MIVNEICSKMQFYDPSRPLTVSHGNLPHWSQSDVPALITWRTADSIPEAVYRAWKEDRDLWLRSNGIDPGLSDWRKKMEELPEDKRREFSRDLRSRWENALDHCHGECVLRCPELARLVGDSLTRFDGDRYELIDFVIMPNHVHLIVVFGCREDMTKTCNSWKRYTGRKINEALGKFGRFWQKESFDHLVRSRRQLEKLQHYIAENPAKANLRPGEFLRMRDMPTKDS